MTYSLSNGGSTTSSVTANYFAANDDRTFSVRISIHNTSTGELLLGSTPLAVGASTSGSVTSGGLSASSDYNIQMIIRRASDYSYLGERNLVIRTQDAPPPAAPVWNASFPNGQVGVGYSGAANASSSDTITWGFLTAPSIPGLSIIYQGTTGFILDGYPTQAGTYSFSARATDSFNQSTDAYWSVTIDAPVQPSWNSLNFGSGKVNSPFSGAISASNATSVSASPNSLAGMPITVSGSTLTLSGTPNAAGTFTTTVTANGGTGSTPAVQTASVTIAPLAPAAWSDTSLSTDFRVLQGYTITSGGNNSLAATNSANFSIISGSLPSGISGTRSLSGTTAFYTLGGIPTTRGPFSFTVRASNSDGTASPDLTFSGNVTHPPLWTDETLGGFNQGRAYSDSLTVSTSTTVTWTLSAGSLPPGIISSTSGANTNTFTLSGTPTGTGSYSFTITATNSDGTLSKTFSGNILLPPSWADNTLGSFIQGVAYSDSVSATNGATYAVTGTLPTGITHSNGLVSGTPTVLNEAYNFTITASNADGSVTQNFTGTVQPDLGGGIKLFNGTTWDNKEIYVYDGTTWVKGTVYMFNGSIWAKSVF